MKNLLKLLSVMVCIMGLMGCEKSINETQVSSEVEISSIENETIIETEQTVQEGVDTLDSTDSLDIEDVPSFSYEEELRQYEEGDYNVKYDDFDNISKVKITNADEAKLHAMREVDLKRFETVEIFFDRETNVWKVLTYTEGKPEETQATYMDKDGLTCLVVYGEIIK